MIQKQRRDNKISIIEIEKCKINVICFLYVLNKNILVSKINEKDLVIGIIKKEYVIQ